MPLKWDRLPDYVKDRSAPDSPFFGDGDSVSRLELLGKGIDAGAIQNVILHVFEYKHI